MFASIFPCVLCIFDLFAGKLLIGKIMFGTSLIVMLVSLAFSIQKIMISVNALRIELNSLEKRK